jgi:hypothetical protein
MILGDIGNNQIQNHDSCNTILDHDHQCEKRRHQPITSNTSTIRIDIESITSETSVTCQNLKAYIGNEVQNQGYIGNEKFCSSSRKKSKNDGCQKRYMSETVSVRNGIIMSETVYVANGLWRSRFSMAAILESMVILGVVCHSVFWFDWFHPEN